MNNYLEIIENFKSDLDKTSRQHKVLCLKCDNSIELADIFEKELKQHKIINLTGKKYNLIEMCVVYDNQNNTYCLFDSKMSDDKLKDALNKFIVKNENLILTRYEFRHYKYQLTIKDKNLSFKDIFDLAKLPNDYLLMTNATLEAENIASSMYPHLILSTTQIDEIDNSILLMDTAMFNSDPQIAEDLYISLNEPFRLGSYGFKLNHRLEQTKFNYRRVVLFDDGNYQGNYNYLTDYLIFL